MEENLRKHILSKYTNADSGEIMTQSEGPTMWTEDIETSDPDEFRALGPTLLTKSIENSDPDGFIVGSTTYITRAVEESDPDEFRLYKDKANRGNISMDQTKHTYTVETSDEDEFLFM